LPSSAQVGWQGRHEGLALASLHRDLAAVRHHTANELDVEVPHLQHAAARFANDRERLREHVVERFAVGRRAEFGSLAQAARRRAVRSSFQLMAATMGAKSLQVTLVLRANDLCEDRVNNHQGRIRSASPNWPNCGALLMVQF
jgi:hypothetical protein